MKINETVTKMGKGIVKVVKKNYKLMKICTVKVMEIFIKIIKNNKK